MKFKPLNRQVIVITGASSGIGLATARMAAAKGAQVVLAARSVDAIRDAADAIEKAGGSALAVETDVADRGAVDQLAAATLARFGTIDTWVNNAGVAIVGKLADVPEADARRLFDIDFWGTVHGVDAALPTLRASGGTIINVASLASDVPTPLMGIYAAAKHAVKAYTDTLRMELEADGAPISVTLIKPGAIATPLQDNQRNLIGRDTVLPPPFYPADDVARAILHAATHKVRDRFIGGSAAFNSWFVGAFPRLADRLRGRAMDGMISDQAVRVSRDNLHAPSPITAEGGDTHGRSVRPSLYTNAGNNRALTASVVVLAGLGAIALFRRQQARRGSNGCPTSVGASTGTAPLRYAPGIERPAADEQETINGIIEGMTNQSQTVAQREHHAVRASHAKSSACVIGELTVADDLPPELAQGLFAQSRAFPVAVRFAQGPGETLADRVSTHRGMSIKVFGVEGETLPGHDADTQDFVLATGPTFPSGTAKGFLRDGTVISGSAGLPEAAKSVISSTMRNFNKLLHAVGIGSSFADFFGHPFSHPLADAYFSQAPMRWGDHVAKIAAFPASSTQRTLRDWRLDPHQDEDGFRHAAVATFGEHDIVFELRAQLWTNAETQPIEDASVEWPTGESAYRTVATIRLPRQAAYSPERVRYFDEEMTFRPAHSLAAHRPLGSVMRARLQVYRALSAFRHRENDVAEASPTNVAEIPA